MGFYSDQILPRIVNVTCGGKRGEPHRKKACEGLHGLVIEIGFGTGHNVPFYPPEIDEVSAVEPADLGWRLAEKRLTASPIPVERSGLDGQSLPFADNSFDTALSTWTMCTIPDADQALRELRRVLKPGGTFHFVEHGLSPDDKVAMWQHRLEPIQKVVGGGCHLTRQPHQMIENAGFNISAVETFYEEGTPRPFGYNTLGLATA